MNENVVAALKVLAEYNQSDELHGMQSTYFARYLELSAMGAFAEAILRRKESDEKDDLS